MALAVREEERKLIKGMLEFANMRKITSAGKVQALFWQPKYNLRKEHKHYCRGIKWFQKRYLRPWLSRMTTEGEEGRKRVAEEIAWPVRNVPVHIELVEEARTGRTGKKGKTPAGTPPVVTRRVAYFYDVYGKDPVVTVRVGCLIALALILDESRGMTSRLKECGWCGKFRLDFELKGAPPKFCNKPHKDLYDSKERVKRKREKREAEKKKAVRAAENAKGSLRTAAIKRMRAALLKPVREPDYPDD